MPVFSDIHFSATQTPLPSTWSMLIAGFAGLGFFAYRGTKKSSAAIAAVPAAGRRLNICISP